MQFLISSVMVILPPAVFHRCTSVSSVEPHSGRALPGKCIFRLTMQANGVERCVSEPVELNITLDPRGLEFVVLCVACIHYLFLCGPDHHAYAVCSQENPASLQAAYTVFVYGYGPVARTTACLVRTTCGVEKTQTLLPLLMRRSHE